MELLNGPGLYIVTLTNAHPISVNAQDPRIADKAIKVTRDNCKFGKAKVLAGRRRNYEKTFGIEHVAFHPIVALADITTAEREVLQRLDPYRIRGRTGRRNEWLERIAAVDVHRLVLATLSSLEIEHEVIPVTFV